MSSIELSRSTLSVGLALQELEDEVRESTINWSDRIGEYLRNAGINFAAPWCAAFIQWVTDEACSILRLPNPLDQVKREAYVNDYYVWAKEKGRLIHPDQVKPGDLSLYSFGGQRYDHIGLIVVPPMVQNSRFTAIEGNTNSTGGREGVEVALRSRLVTDKMRFVRWAA